MSCMQFMKVVQNWFASSSLNALSFANCYRADTNVYFLFKTEQTAVKDNEVKVNGSSLKHVQTNSRVIERSKQRSLQRTVFIHTKELNHGKPLSFFFKISWQFSFIRHCKEICVIFCRWNETKNIGWTSRVNFQPILGVRTCYVHEWRRTKTKKSKQ